MLSSTPILKGGSGLPLACVTLDLSKTSQYPRMKLVSTPCAIGLLNLINDHFVDRAKVQFDVVAVDICCLVAI